MLYKSLHGLSDLEMPTCKTPAIRSTRGNCIKFVQPPAQVDPYKFTFSPDQYTFGIDCRLITLLLPLMTWILYYTQIWLLQLQINKIHFIGVWDDCVRRSVQLIDYGSRKAVLLPELVVRHRMWCMHCLENLD